MAHLLAIDGSNLLMRAFHGAGCTEPAEAIPTVWHMIQGLIRRHAPSHLVVALDAPGPTWRHARFPAYKAARGERSGPSPADLTAAARPHLVDWGVVTAEAPGFEGDDVLAALARRCGDRGGVVSIVSGDRDLLQLVRLGCRVLRPGRGSQETAFSSASDVRSLLGVDPGQVADWKALAGDVSDGIPRVE